MYNSAVNVWK